MLSQRKQVFVADYTLWNSTKRNDVQEIARRDGTISGVVGRQSGTGWVVREEVTQ